MLYIWMPEGTAAWRWCIGATGKTQDLQFSEWQQAEHLDALMTATQSLAQREVVVFFPTTYAHVVQKQLTRAQRRQLGDQGIRYLLEEYTLGSVDQFEVRDQFIAEDQLAILAVPTARVQQMIQTMALGSWQLQALLPDFLLLPHQADAATLWLHTPTALLRLNEGYALAVEDLTVVLPRLPDISALNVFGQPTPIQQELLSEADVPLSYRETILPAPTFVAASRHPYNVLPKPKGHVISPYWKAVAALAVLAVLVQVLHDGLTAWRYQQVAQATMAQAEQQFRQWFPDEQRIINLRRQMEGRLQSHQEQDITALSLLARVAPVLQQAQLVAQSVRYRDQVLELDILAGNLAALEQLRNQFTQQGLTAELGAVNPAPDNQVNGLLRVKP